MNTSISYSSAKPARVMAIMPHADDFEFQVAGTFALLRKSYGEAVKLKIITTSKGATGHHLLDSDETFTYRQTEARQSATHIGAEHECLVQLDGEHVSGQVLITKNLLGGVWNAVRQFGADYLFVPPPAGNVIAGVHIDHENTAQAVRLVAYQLGVPRAYPTLGKEANPDYRPPVVFLTDDSYSSENACDIAQDISETYTIKLAMVECHASQVFEWLPFVARRPAPSKEQYAVEFRERHRRVNERFGYPDECPREFFRISRWGRSPSAEEIDWLFPRRIQDTIS